MEKPNWKELLKREVERVNQKERKVSGALFTDCIQKNTQESLGIIQINF